MWGSRPQVVSDAHEDLGGGAGREFHPSGVAADAHRRQRDPPSPHHPQRSQTEQLPLREGTAEAHRLRDREIDGSGGHQRGSRECDGHPRLHLARGVDGGCGRATRGSRRAEGRG